MDPNTARDLAQALDDIADALNSAFRDDGIIDTVRALRAAEAASRAATALRLNP